MASLLALTGCQKEELVNDNNTPGSGEKVILTANIQGSAQTRVTLTPVTENGTTIVKVAWNESGEKFKVYGLDEDGWPNSSSLAWFTQKEGTNQFMGTLPSTNNGTYCAFYGDDEEGSGSNVFEFFLDEQDGTLYQRDENYSTVLMGAEFSSFSEPITFKQMTAILKPTFKVGDADIDNTITKIVMGNVILPTVAVASEEIIIAPTSSATALADDIYIHLPIMNMLDGEFSNMHDGKYLAGHEFTFTVTAGGKDYTGSLTIPTGMSIEEGKFYTATIALEEKIPYLTFTVGGKQSLVLNVMGQMDQSIEYSADGRDWTEFDMEGSNATTPVPFTNNLRMRGKSASGTFEVDYEAEKINGFFISFTEENIPVTCSGDIRTLVDYTNYETTSTATACFYGLFMDCSALADASKLQLISNNNKMAASCYESMFARCSTLKSAPALPATTLAESCYKGMFQGCTSLKSAPALPATTLADFCYLEMFDDCTNLKSAPELPATTLAKSCYKGMFQVCTSLTTAPALPATTLAEYCYADMFYYCTSLTTAPELPAETLVTGCYWIMFKDCTSLNSVTMLATDIEAENCLTKWMEGVAAAGTFTKAASMTSLPTGVSGIPEDWTVEDYGQSEN